MRVAYFMACRTARGVIVDYAGWIDDPSRSFHLVREETMDAPLEKHLP
jgi:hypothetical protein